MAINKNLFAVILAGGSGTRFWPMSRKSRPKQYLNILGKETLFQKTLKRVRKRVSAKNIFIVTSAAHKKFVKEQILGFKISASNILFEPAVRNTAPAICWASARINRINPQAIIAVFPSDHLIVNQEKFLKVLDEAVEIAKDDYLVTLGITPTRPETGYGYLKTEKLKIGVKDIIKVKEFTEKPSINKAKKFIKDKRYFWNSGMFLWRSSVILNEFSARLPGIYKALVSKNSQQQINKIYKRLENVSIDYGILEKAKNVAAVEAKDIGWSDLGSWESLMEVLPKDNNGNHLKGNVAQLDCSNTLIIAGKRIVAAVGLENFVIVDTPDALLICQKQMSQRVKDIVSVL